MDKWRPIETAPRDRSEVLVAWSDGQQAVAALHGSSWYVLDQIDYFGDDAPTFWQPLPPPPEPAD